MPLIPVADIVDFQTRVSGNADVQAATLLRHAQAHSLVSTDDHSDVDDTRTPQAGDALVYSGTAWRPTPTFAANYGPAFLLMGG